MTKRTAPEVRCAVFAGVLLALLCAIANADTETPRESVSIGGSRDALTLIVKDANLRDALEYLAYHQRLFVQAHVALPERVTISIIELPLPEVLLLLLRDFSFELELEDDPAGGGRLCIYPRDAAVMQPLAEPDYFGPVAARDAVR